MKKILSIFLTLSIIISVTACFGGKPDETTQTTQTTQTTTESTTATTEATTAVTTYPGMQKPSTKGGAAFLITNAKNKSVNQKSYCAEIFEEVTVTSNKSDLNYNGVFEADFNVLSKTEYSVNVKESIGINGETLTSNSKLYAKDGFYYLSESGINAKYESNEENDAELNIISEISEMIKSIPEKSISEITEDEKNIYITVDLKKDNSYSIFNDILSSMEESIAAMSEILSIETQRIITSAKVDIAVDRDGYLKSYTPSITFSYMTPTDGVSSVTKISYVYSVSFFRDKEVALDIPEGYESFPLYSEENIAFETLSAAIDKTLALTDYNVTQFGSIYMEFSGISTEILYRSDMAVKGENTDGIVFRETLQFQAFNNLLYSDIYYENGYYYMTSGTDTGKISKDQIEDDPNELIKNLLKESLVLVSKDGTTQIEIQPDPIEENVTELHFVLDETYFRLNFSAQIDSYIELIGLDIKDMVISEPELYVYVTEDGYIDYYEVSYYLDGTMVSAGQEIAVSLLIYDGFEYTAIGEEATVTPPTGYKSFPSTNVNT